MNTTLLGQAIARLSSAKINLEKILWHADLSQGGGDVSADWPEGQIREALGLVQDWRREERERRIAQRLDLLSVPSDTCEAGPP